MYSLLVVDDEALVRNAVSKIINWDSLGFTTIYQAEDGLDALEVVRKHKVDLILTDIVMPYMDGLELSKVISKEFPDIHIVILTGHEDFEYAKQSVDLGVKNYILKPVGASTLYTKMNKICKNLNIKSSQKQYIAKMRTQINESMPALQEKFLYTLVCTQHMSRQDLTERIAILDLPLMGGAYIVGIVEIDLSHTSNSDIELFTFTTKNITHDSIGKAHCIFDDNNKIMVVFNLKDLHEDAHLIIYDTLQVIQKAVSSILKVDVTCAMGSMVECLTDLHLSYTEASKALDCKYSLGANRVYAISDLDYIEKSFFYPVEVIKDLIYSVKFLGAKDIKKATDDIVKMLLKQRNLSSANIKMICVEIVTSLLKELSGVKQVSSETWNEGFSLYNHLEKNASHENILNKIYVFSVKVSEELRNLQINSGHLIVENVKQYVLEKYNDDSLSLSTVAEHISVSTGYLSGLFKKETGINFVKYLTDIRMEKAMELLKTTDKKTYEIAYETGFANPHYFSISFKKYLGVSPSDFRNIHLEKDV